jgi:hypothetical protein
MAEAQGIDICPSYFIIDHDRFVTNKITGINGLKRKGDKAYKTTPVPFHKKDFRLMLERGEIMDIDRE